MIDQKYRTGLVWDSKKRIAVAVEQEDNEIQLIADGEEIGTLEESDWDDERFYELPAGAFMNPVQFFKDFLTTVDFDSLEDDSMVAGVQYAKQNVEIIEDK